MSQKDENKKLLVVTGPTATGKTSLAANVAAKINGEIISADSRQVFRGMTIGTGKDLEDYTVNDKKIPVHLIDIKEAGEKYSVFEFQNNFLMAYSDIRRRNRFPVLCGGTGLYIESVVKQYRLLDVPRNASLRENLKNKSLEELTGILSELKTLHNQTDVDTRSRAIRAIEIAEYSQHHQLEETKMPPLNSIVVAPSFDRPQIRERITIRLYQRLQEGMVDEVQALRKKGVPDESLISYGLEYKYITWYLMDKLTYDEMTRQLKIAIHQFAKRQMTWFRRMERKGTKIHWIDGYLPMHKKVEKVVNLLNQM